MKLFIAGEGSDEIGDWAKDPAYRPATPKGGIVEALLRRIRDDGWYVAGGCPWRRIRKYRVGRGLHDWETRNVLGVIDQAVEQGCDAIAFVRDRDGEVEREQAIEAAIARAPEFGLLRRVIGGVAIETTDAWILALLGGWRSERERDAKQTLRERHSVNDGLSKAEVVIEANLDLLPADASSLRSWLDRSRAVFLRGDDG